MSISGDRGVFVLLGPNGAGKTTLLRLLTGDLRPSHGKVLVDGQDPARQHRSTLARVGWMPQEIRLPRNFRLSEFVAYAGWLKGLEWSLATARAGLSLERVGLADRSGDRIRQLSGGMMRRAAFAAAVVHDPPILLLDEPMAGLDPEQRAQLRSIIVEQGARSCVVLSTHILQDSARWIPVIECSCCGMDGSYSMAHMRSSPVYPRSREISSPPIFAQSVNAVVKTPRE